MMTTNNEIVGMVFINHETQSRLRLIYILLGHGKINNFSFDHSDWVSYFNITVLTLFARCYLKINQPLKL